MSEGQRLSPQNSLTSLCSYRYQCSADSLPRSLRPTTSFITVNHKRSFRPPPYILHSLVECFPDRVPLSFAVANPAVRLFTERSVGCSGCHPRPAFVMDGYSVTREASEPFVAPCDEGGVVEDDTPVTRRKAGPAPKKDEGRAEDSLGRSPDSLSVASSPQGGAVQSPYSRSLEGSDHVQAYLFSFTGPYLSSLTSVAEQHYYPVLGYHDPGSGGSCDARSRGGRYGRLGRGSAVFSEDPMSGGGGRGPRRHRAGSPPSQASNVGGGPSYESLLAEMRVCDGRCWHGGGSDLSLCASLCCSSTKGLRMVLFSAWWLSRYYGISLTLKGFRQRDQLAVFKEIVQHLSVRELTCVRCVLSQEWMQTISACTDLVSLTFAGCEADSEVPLMYVDSILTRPASSAQKQHHPQPYSHPQLPPRPANQSKWYIAGNLSVGILRHLRCFHLIHTPVKQEFLDALVACAERLECILLHKSRGIRNLDPVAQLAHLRCLSLQSSSIDNRGVEALGACRKLQRLFLVECRRLLSLGFLRRELSQSLKQLTLSNNWFSEEHMRDVAACTGLMELHLHSLKRLTSIAPLASLRDLEVMSLADTAVTEEGTHDALKRMRLVRLNMSSCTAITSVEAWLGFHGTTLTSLDLSASGLQSDGLSSLASCMMLRYLNLADCSKVTSIAALRQIAGLRWLDLSGTSVTDTDLHKQFSGSIGKTLKYLSLRDCKGVRHLHFLDQLSLSPPPKSGAPLCYLDVENTSITDRDMASVQACKALKYLNMNRCARLTTVQPLGALPQLRELHLSHTGVTAEALTGIAHCTALEVLDLRSCRQLNSIAALASLPTLKQLLLDYYGHGKVDSSLRHLHHQQQQLAFSAVASGNSQGTLSPLPGDENGGSTNGSSTSGFARSRALSARSVGSTGSTSSAPSALLSPHWGNSDTSLARGVGGTSGSPHEWDCTDISLPGAQAESNEAVSLKALESFSARKSVMNESGLLSLLGASTHLTFLDISECRYATDLRGLECLSCLRELIACQCPHLSNAAICTISSFSCLQRLWLLGCSGVTDLSPLGRLQKLEELDASLTQVVDEGLSHLGLCVGLKTLYLTECRSLTSVRPLAPLPFLQELHLESTAVTDAGVSALVSCTGLQRLYLTKCKRLTDVTQLAASLKQLEVLDVYGTSIPTRVAGAPRSSACSLM